MSQRKPTPKEAKFLREGLDADYRNVGIRLREGEYQYLLAQAIASFQLELHFPNVRDLARKLYGEQEASDVQFIRKIQTILKKMEKGDVVKILPKKAPWELQRYALLSFKFQDIDKNLVTLAGDDQIKKALYLLDSALSQEEILRVKAKRTRIKIGALLLGTLVSYTAIIWNFFRPVVDPIIFAGAFSIAVACSLMLGRQLT